MTDDAYHPPPPDAAAPGEEGVPHDVETLVELPAPPQRPKGPRPMDGGPPSHRDDILIELLLESSGWPLDMQEQAPHSRINY